MSTNPGLLRLDCGVARLRPWRREDLASLRAHAQPGDGVARAVVAFPYPYAGGDGRAWLARVIDAPGCAWAIEYGGQAIGGISLERDGACAGSSEIGYWIGRRFHGRGLMGAILPRFTRAALRQRALQRITALVYAGNEASRRVLEKAGFRCEGSRDSAVLGSGGRPLVAWQYAIRAGAGVPG
jgi:RimJ/RimL family protein N-acetyltransferase